MERRRTRTEPGWMYSVRTGRDALTRGFVLLLAVFALIGWLR